MLAQEAATMAEEKQNETDLHALEHVLEQEHTHHYFRDQPPKINLRVKLKIIIGFLQVVMAMESFMDISWPVRWEYGLGYFRWLGLKWYSVDFVACIFNSTYFERYALQMIAPIILVFLIPFLVHIADWRHKVLLSHLNY